MCAVFAVSRIVKFFLTVGLHGDKAVVGFQSFELIGIGEEAACVSEDVSEPSALFFDGEEVVNFRLIAGRLWFGVRHRVRGVFG